MGVVKITAGLIILVGGGTAIYLGKEYLDNYISKYEYALIDYLLGKDNDIVFDVKKGENADQDLSDSDIAFTNGQPQKVTVSAIVQVAGTSGSSFKKSGGNASIDDEQMKGIKALNGGN